MFGYNDVRSQLVNKWLLVVLALSISLVVVWYFFYPFTYGVVSINGNRVSYWPWTLRNEMNDARASYPIPVQPDWQKPVIVNIDDTAEISMVCRSVGVLSCTNIPMQYKLNSNTIEANGFNSDMRHLEYGQEVELCLNFNEKTGLFQVEDLKVGGVYVSENDYVKPPPMALLNCLKYAHVKIPDARINICVEFPGFVSWSIVHNEFKNCFDFINNWQFRGLTMYSKDGRVVITIVGKK